MAANIYRVTLTGLSSTNGTPVYFPDLAQTPFSVSVSAAVNSTNANFTVEYTLDYTGGSSTWISSNATWFPSSSITAATTNVFAFYNTPVTAIRLNSTGGSSAGTIAFTIVQAG